MQRHADVQAAVTVTLDKRQDSIHIDKLTYLGIFAEHTAGSVAGSSGKHSKHAHKHGRTEIL